MRMVGEQFIEAPAQRVWEGLNDPSVLRASIPGCQTLDKSPDGQGRFDATVEVRVGPVGARFKGAMTLADLNPPTGYTLLLEGNGGIAGSAKGTAKVHLGAAEGGTVVKYEVDAQVGGRMAQLGGPVIDAAAKDFAKRFFSSFGDEVSGKPRAASAVTTAAPVTAASPTARPTHAAAPAAAAPTSRGLPFAWILAVFVAAVAGFQLGRDPDVAGSGWAGLAIGLLVILVAAAAFQFGRRAAAPTIVVDVALLRRLTEESRR